MSIDSHGLKVALRQLCKREGARGSRLLRLSPPLEVVYGIIAPDTPGQRRQKLVDATTRLLNDHPEYQELLLVALGLDRSAQQETLGGRLDWLGSNKRHVSLRTLKRQLDDAIARFAENATAAPRAWSAPEDVGYVVEEFDGTLTFMGERAILIDRRKIRAARGQLQAIKCWLGVAPPQVGEAEPAITVLAAGRVHEDCRLHRQGNTLECTILLPQPLRAGEVYEFEVSYELPANRLKPFYVVQPSTPFKAVSLTVRFDPCSVPAEVWLVEGVMHWEIENSPSADKLLQLDPSVRCRAAFHDTREGRSYGMAWRWWQPSGRE